MRLKARPLGSCSRRNGKSEQKKDSLASSGSRNRLLSGEHNIFPAGGRDRGFNKLPKIFKISWSE
jgi:hypothetical protein